MIDEPHASPDARWIAYGSNESGEWEVYIARFPSFSDRRQVSKNGGGQALWRADGRELYYLDPDGNMMAVEIDTGPRLHVQAPKILFKTLVHMAPKVDQYGVTSDGKRFLISEPVERPLQPINIVVNWMAGLQAGRQ